MIIALHHRGVRYDVETDASLGAETVEAQLMSIIEEDPDSSHWFVTNGLNNILHIGNLGQLAQHFCQQPNNGHANRFSFEQQHAVSVTQNAVFTDPPVRDFASSCTRVHFGAAFAIPQAQFLCSDGTAVCVACAMQCRQGQCQPSPSIVHMSSFPSFVCACSTCVSGMPNISKPPSGAYGAALSDTASLLGVLVSLQQSNAAVERFRRRIQMHVSQVREYESRDLQELYRKAMPLDQWRTGGRQIELLEDMMKWFKHQYFRWITAPPCATCQGGTSCIGGAPANPDEAMYGAGHVEVYKCNENGCNMTRFPRFNSARKLLDTRCGRCGEWAQAFTACCRALGFKARFVVDWTDHVWTEVYLADEGRWIHTDCCEDIRDAPLVYEAGWGKKLSYIVAVSVDEVRDVTQRYTQKWAEVLTRRHEIGEHDLQMLLAEINASLQNSISSEKRVELERAWQKEWTSILDVQREREAEALKAEETRTRLSGHE